VGADIGKAKTAFYKLSAVYMAPSAIGSMIATGMGDDAVGKVVGTGAFLILYWGLFVFIFRPKNWQALVCVACTVLVRYAALVWVVGALSGLFVTRGIH
jgi:hypothetical protein